MAACKQEVPPLFVIEFLHRVVHTFEDYFDDCSESIIKENYVLVYELLDEMLNNVFPLATESNILKELIQASNEKRDGNKFFRICCFFFVRSLNFGTALVSS